MSDDSQHQIKQWDRGGHVPDPDIPQPEPGQDSRGRWHCPCGVSFGPLQFDAFYNHDCAYRREEHEAR